MKHRTGTLFMAVAVAALPLLSQSQPAQKKSFEVASIKSVNTRGIANRISVEGGRFSSPVANAWGLMRWAYRPPEGGPIFYNDYQIIGAPEWMRTDRFSVEARAESESRQVPVEEMREMVQSLLEDRFQLRVHQEIRQLPVYELVVSKGGLRMKPSEDQTPPALPQRGERGQRGQRGQRGAAQVRGRTYVDIQPISSGFQATMTGTGVSIPVLINRIQEGFDRPVVDKTHLEGLFDMKLQFTVPAGPDGDPTEADIFAALLTSIQEQLGLKLESSKGPNSVLVVDAVQKPAEN
jgi:uncharacterized protein (TIGR03435 family)